MALSTTWWAWKPPPFPHFAQTRCQRASARNDAGLAIAVATQALPEREPRNHGDALLALDLAARLHRRPVFNREAAVVHQPRTQEAHNRKATLVQDFHDPGVEVFKIIGVHWASARRTAYGSTGVPG